MPESSRGSFVAEAADSGEVIVPKDPNTAVTLEAPTSSTTQSLSIHLPDEVNVGKGIVADDGTVVYESRGGSNVDAAVQVLEGGDVRLQTVAHDETAPTSFTYQFGDGIIPVADNDGSIDLLQDIGNVRAEVGSIEPAWAVDADGHNVETQYRVDGNSIIQDVTVTEDTTFPVVADPKVTRTWWNTTVYFNRKETNTLGWGSGSVAAIFAAVPDPTISKVLAAGAGLATAYVGWIYNDGKCVKFVYYGHAVNVWQPYGNSEAGGYCKTKKP